MLRFLLVALWALLSHKKSILIVTLFFFCHLPKLKSWIVSAKHLTYKSSPFCYFKLPNFLPTRNKKHKQNFLVWPGTEIRSMETKISSITERHIGARRSVGFSSLRRSLSRSLRSFCPVEGRSWASYIDTRSCYCEYALIARLDVFRR